MYNRYMKKESHNLAIISLIICMMVVIFTGCRKEPPANPYGPAWQDFLNTLIEDGIIEDTTSVIYTDGDMGEAPITIRTSDQCPYSYNEIIEEYLLPAFANNNDLASYISYRYHNRIYANWTIDIYVNEEHLSVDCREGLNIYISSNSYRSTFEPISLNLSDYRTANEDSGLTSDSSNRICTLYDISGYIVAISENYPRKNLGVVWSNTPIIIYIDSTCPAEEVDRIADEAFVVYTDKDLFFFYADTGERIWVRR